MSGFVFGILLWIGSGILIGISIGRAIWNDPVRKVEIKALEEHVDWMRGRLQWWSKYAAELSRRLWEEQRDDVRDADWWKE